ncbi:TMEM43 family protein [Lysobacter sp. A3-1-A15]|uniref:TMEM43 family protein n=1 Tax=Novilysobacter viscosus TaxID=3098602 RepID=UPI002ED929DE
MNCGRAWRAVVVACLLLAASPMAAAVARTAPARPVLLVEEAIPSPGAVLADPDFGVTTRAFGLDRQVQMYQWRRHRGRLERVWSAGRIESADFGDAHQNPELPLDAQRWWARDATLAGHPMDATVIQGLGEWRPFRPGFSELPLNMAATFQPEGDGLGSAENPLAPEVGDLRITWRELHLPPLLGRVELRNGRWQLSPRTAEAALNAAPLPPVSAPEAVANEATAAPPAATGRPGGTLWPWLLAGALLALALAGLVYARRRRPG